MKTRGWLLLFTAVAALCLLFYVFAPKTGGSVVGIYQDGALVRTIDLAAVGESYELVLERNGSTNTILVEKNAIRVVAADCPDQVCVEHGELRDGASPIVCLPNRVVIKYLRDTDGVDAKAGSAG